MPINDEDYLNDPEITEFLYQLRTCEPTHYSNDDDFLVNSFNDSHFYAYPSSIYPDLLVIHMSIMFCKKFATYNPGKEQIIEKVFYSSMPLAIWCSEEGASDRTLIWGNGGVTLTLDNELILFIDKDLGERLSHNE